ncbi:MAG TPA: choice-of-anchor tandem repeat GloVer-containing protein [Bryobacteraceae bacterium]|nr:choice-of-anchor tandem repeat GloVer-containing protein [Bryobacteraceae bacterium]
MKRPYRIAFAAALALPLLAAGGAKQAGYEVLYRFTGYPDGATPRGLIAGPNGVFYGVTAYGGAYNYGTVFQLTPPAAPGGSWTETIIHSFQGWPSDGLYPPSAPTLGASGELYVVSQSGIYEFQPGPSGTWTETALYTAITPVGSVVIGAGGELYGVTNVGGKYYDGVVYELAPPSAPGGTWTYSTLYDFTGDGRQPSGLAIGANGALYGTTYYGGSYGAGVIFQLTPPTVTGGAWNYDVIYAFTGGADGGAPLQPPTIAAGGSLYCTTTEGGSGGKGTVVKVTAQASGIWIPSVLYDFASTGDGSLPDSPLILHNGALFGATVTGTSAREAGGTVFALGKTAAGSWAETVLHAFPGAAGPAGSLAIPGDGAIYGTATTGPGADGLGMFYQVALH